MEYQEETGAPAIVLAFWRSSSTFPVMVGGSLLTAWWHGRLVPKLERRVVLITLAAGFGYGAWAGSFAYSLAKTTVAHLYLFNNAHSLLLVIGKLLTGQSVRGRPQGPSH